MSGQLPRLAQVLFLACLAAFMAMTGAALVHYAELEDALRKIIVETPANSWLGNAFSAQSAMLRNFASTGGLLLAFLIIFLLAAEHRSRLLAGTARADRDAAKAARQHLDQAIGAISEGFVLYDASGRFEMCNGRYREFHHAIAGMLVSGTAYRDIAAAKQLAGISDPEIGIGAQTLTHEQMMPDGRWLRSTETRMADGRLVGVTSDITEMKNREIALGRAKKALQKQFTRLETMAREASKASVAKSEFLAMMSHDIRTPLNAVIGLADLLAATPLDDEQQKYLKAMNNASENLMALINDILDLTRMEAGKLSAEQAAYSPRALCAEMQNVTQVLADKSGNTVRVDIDDGLPEALIGDNDRLRQVLLNLVGNAIKFTKNGTIVLAARREDTSSGEPRVRYSVSDNGAGIPDELRKRMFLPFEQGKDARAASSQSTGLGLAISERLVHIMGGAMEVETAEGRGSTFSFSLPLAAAEPASLPKPAVELKPDLAGRRILVADDTPANLMVVEQMLANWGADVVTATNGKEAVDAAAASRFDLVYLDLQMPVMDGMQAMREMRDSGNANLPVVALTAQGFPRQREHALDAGFTDFVSKPLRARDFAANLSAHLGLDQASQPLAAHSAPKHPAPAHGFAMVDELCAEIGANAVRSLAVRFDADVLAALERLHDGQRQACTQTIARAAHKLTGLLAQFGLDAAAAQSRKTEQTASESDIEHLTRLARKGLVALSGHIGSMAERRAA